MRFERYLLPLLLVIPVLVAVIGWPAFVNWAVGPPPAAPTPEVAGAAATSVATARANAPTPRPTIGAPRAPAAATAAPAQATPATAQASGDPSATVADFYNRVAQHDFASAAQLWSPRMQATFPPRENIDERFSQTQSVSLRRADVVSQDPSSGQATVAVDLVESTGGASHHWVGTWYLVRGQNGWLLDQPQLQGVSP